jgi:hypothetical protein
VPSADIDEREFTADTWERFEDFADHMLTSIPPETQLDVFRLHLVTGKAGSDRWIRRGLQHVPAAVDIRAARNHTVVWQPHVGNSPESWAAGFTCRLKTLHLVGVNIVGFSERLRKYCPVLEDLHVERCLMHPSIVASPMLRSLSVVDPNFSGIAAPIMITAPSLAFIRLELSDEGAGYHGNAGYPEPLAFALLARASIRVLEKGLEEERQPVIRGQKIYLLNSMCSFLALAPNVINLHLTGFTIAVSIPINLIPCDFLFS